MHTISFLSLLLLLSFSSCKKDSTSSNSESTSASRPETPAPEREETGAKELVDEEYRFRLTSPGTDWQLEPREEIQRITPDAKAGLSHRSGLTGVVIVERAVGMTLEEMSDLVINGMPVENKNVVVREELEFVGLPAIGYRIEGSVNDVPMDYSGRIFLRGGYAFQIVTFAARGVASQEDTEKVFKSFALTEGEIVVTARKMKNVDATGIGWRLQDGVFESAVSGLRVTPTGNWRAVVGAEARRINVDAEVVMICSEPEAYFFVLPERIGNAKPDVYLKDRLDLTIAGMKGEVSQSQYKSKIAGQAVTMHSLHGEDFPWTFQFGVGFDGGWAIQATGWYSSSYGDEGKEAVLEALKSVHKMSRAEVASLSAELLAAPDQQNQVGTDHSLRNGVFEDYTNGMRWTKPRGFWEVSVGHAARDVNPIAQLYGRYENSAAHMLLAAESIPEGMSEAAYHDASFGGVRTNLGLTAKVRSKKSKIGSGPALLSDATVMTAGIEIYYRVVTAVRGTRAVQLHLWGPASSMADNKDMLVAVADELELVGDLVPARQEGERLTDRRLGYSMDLPVVYRYVDATPAEIGGIGSFATWGVDGQDWVGLLALCMIEEGQDHDWSMRFMEERIRDSYSELINELSAERNDTTLFGLPARHLVWKSLTMRLDAYLFRKNNTIYALLATDVDRGTDMRERALAGFKFLNP